MNNAIVLIDYIDLLRDRDGVSRRESLVQGGMKRFRPVILTAITTALGLVPLAIGLNLDFFGLYGCLAPDLFWGGVQAAWWAPMAHCRDRGDHLRHVPHAHRGPRPVLGRGHLADLFRRHFVAENEEQVAGWDGPYRGSDDLVPLPGHDGRHGSDRMPALRRDLEPDPHGSA